MFETQALTTIVEKPFRPTLDQQVAAWLHTKKQRSMSKHTLICYSRQMQSFRGVLQQAGLDLDGDPGLIAVLAEGWASRPIFNDLYHSVASIKRYKKIESQTMSAGTFNNRISSISSFYEFAIVHDWFTRNPMKKIDARPGSGQGYAHHMEASDIQRCLQRIDRSSLVGKRDFAILLLALGTGRRLAEFSGVKWGDLKFDSHGRVIVAFPHCKGGKAMEDLLEPEVLDAILEYLHMLYGTDDLGSLPPETPLWVRLRGERKQLGGNGVRQIWIKWLGTSKVHSSRHSFAIAMLRVGAGLDDIASRLGHSNASTTAIYLKRAGSAENKYGAKLLQGFIGGEAQQ